MEWLMRVKVVKRYHGWTWVISNINKIPYSHLGPVMSSISPSATINGMRFISFNPKLLSYISASAHCLNSYHDCSRTKPPIMSRFAVSVWLTMTFWHKRLDCQHLDSMLHISCSSEKPRCASHNQDIHMWPGGIWPWPRHIWPWTRDIWPRPRDIWPQPRVTYDRDLVWHMTETPCDI